MIAGMLALSSSGFVAPLNVRASSQLVVSMSEATRDPSPSFDNDMSGWKPPSGGGDSHACGGEYTPTDTPDFLPEEGSEQAAKAAGISYMDGIQGSQHDPNRKKSSGPELAGALESNPDIYVPDKLDINVDTSDFVLPEPEWRLSKMAISSTHQDFEFTCSSTMDKDFVVDVAPVCMTFEDFYCGFTADSHPAFSVSPSKGTMERRNGTPTQIVVHCNPQGSSGDLVAHLCFILPEEKDFSTYYKITCHSQ